jgi:ABC-type branched-subunit amino acid transport system substrate-binding protein
VHRPFLARCVIVGAALIVALWSPPRARAADLETEAERYYRRGDFSISIKLYDALARGGSLDDGMRYHYGLALLFQGECAGAAEVLKPLKDGLPGTEVDREVLSLALGYCLLERGKEKEAAGVLPRNGNGKPSLPAVARRLLESLEAKHENAGAAQLSARLKSSRRGAGWEWLGGRESADAAREAAAMNVPPLPESGRPDQRVTIGAMIPLSGNYEYFGRRVLQGFTLAFEEYGDAEGITLAVHDTAGDPDTGKAGFSELVDKERAVAILGPVLSSVAEKIAPLSSERRIPVLTPAAQAPALTSLSPYLFRNCLTLHQQGRFMARLAMQGMGLTRFAVLAPDDNYGRILSRAFWEEVTSLGGRITHSATYALTQTDFAKEIRAIKGENDISKDDGEADAFHPTWEALFVPDTHQRVALLAPQLTFHDIVRKDFVLMGGSGLDHPDLIRIGEKEVEGTVFLDAFFDGSEDERVRGFVERYRARFGEAPEVMAAQAYDSAAILISLVRWGNRDSESIRRALAGLKEFPGVCGPTSMDAAREAIRPPVFLTVKEGAITGYVPPREVTLYP